MNGNISGFSGGMIGPQPDPPKPAKELEQVLVASPIEGWRCWNIHRPESLTLTRDVLMRAADSFDTNGNPFRALAEQLNPRLSAIGVSAVWDEPTMSARCMETAMSSWSSLLYFGASSGPPPPRHTPHEAPHSDCQCGFWTLRTKDEAEAMLAKVEAYGRVAIWGRVVEFDKGYRAQYARPLEIVLLSPDEETAQVLRDFYGCEVRLNPSIKAAAVEREVNAQRAAMKAELQIQAELMETMLHGWTGAAKPRRKGLRRAR